MRKNELPGLHTVSDRESDLLHTRFIAGQVDARDRVKTNTIPGQHPQPGGQCKELFYQLCRMEITLAQLGTEVRKSV